MLSEGNSEMQRDGSDGNITNAQSSSSGGGVDLGRNEGTGKPSIITEVESGRLEQQTPKQNNRSRIATGGSSEKKSLSCPSADSIQIHDMPKQGNFCTPERKGRGDRSSKAGSNQDQQQPRGGSHYQQHGRAGHFLPTHQSYAGGGGGGGYPSSQSAASQQQNHPGHHGPPTVSGSQGANGFYHSQPGHQQPHQGGGNVSYHAQSQQAPAGTSQPSHKHSSHANSAQQGQHALPQTPPRPGQSQGAFTPPRGERKLAQHPPQQHQGQQPPGTHSNHSQYYSHPYYPPQGPSNPVPPSPGQGGEYPLPGQHTSHQHHSSYPHHALHPGAPQETGGDRNIHTSSSSYPDSARYSQPPSAGQDHHYPSSHAPQYGSEYNSNYNAPNNASHPVAGSSSASYPYDHKKSGHQQQQHQQQGGYGQQYQQYGHTKTGSSHHASYSHPPYQQQPQQGSSHHYPPQQESGYHHPAGHHQNQHHASINNPSGTGNPHPPHSYPESGYHQPHHGPSHEVSHAYQHHPPPQPVDHNSIARTVSSSFAESIKSKPSAEHESHMGHQMNRNSMPSHGMNQVKSLASFSYKEDGSTSPPGSDSSFYALKNVASIDEGQLANHTQMREAEEDKERSRKHSIDSNATEEEKQVDMTMGGEVPEGIISGNPSNLASLDSLSSVASIQEPIETIDSKDDDEDENVQSGKDDEKEQPSVAIDTRLFLKEKQNIRRKRSRDEDQRGDGNTNRGKDSNNRASPRESEASPRRKHRREESYTVHHQHQNSKSREGRKKQGHDDSPSKRKESPQSVDPTYHNPTPPPVVQRPHPQYPSVVSQPSHDRSQETNPQMSQGLQPPASAYYFDKPPSYSYSNDSMSSIPTLPNRNSSFPPPPPRPNSASSSTIGQPPHIGRTMSSGGPPGLSNAVPSWDIQANDSFASAIMTVGSGEGGGGNNGGDQRSLPLLNSFSFTNDYPTNTVYGGSAAPPPPPPTYTEGRNPSFDQHLNLSHSRSEDQGATPHAPPPGEGSYHHRQQPQPRQMSHHHSHFPTNSQRPVSPAPWSSSVPPQSHHQQHHHAQPPPHAYHPHYVPHPSQLPGPSHHPYHPHMGRSGSYETRASPPPPVYSMSMDTHDQRSTHNAFQPPQPEFHRHNPHNKPPPAVYVIAQPHLARDPNGVPTQGLTGPGAKGVYSWTKDDDARLTEIMKKYRNPRDWEPIAKEHGRGKSAKECHERWIRYLKPGVRKGQWQDHEDAIVVEAVTNSTEQPFTRWSDLAQRLPGRVGKQIRDRWVNHLNPAINHMPFAREDDLLLFRGHEELGKRWVEISTKYFNSSRSENHIKNRWYSASFKKFIANEYGPEAYTCGSKDKEKKKKDKQDSMNNSSSSSSSKDDTKDEIKVEDTDEKE